MRRWRLAIVIVHYRTPGILLECLRSVAAEIDSAPPHRDCVVVVDNASGADDVAALRDFAEGAAWLTLIESPVNGGFAAGNNLGILQVQRGGGAEYFVLLNPDTVVMPGAFGALREFLERHPEAACAGPRLQGADGVPQLSAFGAMSPVSELIRGANIGVLSRVMRRWEVYGARREEPHPCAWLSGACVMLRGEVFDAVGLLDAGYFMYFEEVDFFRRARGAGFGCWYVPEARVVHLVGQSSGIRADWAARRVPPYWFESRRRYFRKHFGRIGVIAADLLWFTGHLLMRIRRLFTGVSHSPVAPRESRDLLRHTFRELVRP